MQFFVSKMAYPQRCCEMFLADLESRWQESAVISTIADIVLKHATDSFHVYVKYCSNQIYQDRMLKHLKVSTRNSTSTRYLKVSRTKNIENTSR